MRGEGVVICKIITTAKCRSVGHATAHNTSVRVRCGAAVYIILAVPSGAYWGLVFPHRACRAPPHVRIKVGRGAGFLPPVCVVDPFPRGFLNPIPPPLLSRATSRPGPASYSSARDPPRPTTTSFRKSSRACVINIFTVYTTHTRITVGRRGVGSLDKANGANILYYVCLSATVVVVRDE